MKSLPWVACATVALLSSSVVEATVYEVLGQDSRDLITLNWYDDVGHNAHSDLDGSNPVTLSGVVDVSTTMGPLGGPEQLTYGPLSAIEFGTHSVQMQIQTFAGGSAGTLAVTLSGITLRPEGSVTLDGIHGALGPLPVAIGARLGTPVLTYQYTSLSGDVLGGGSANLWRYSPDVLQVAELRSNALDYNWMAQSMWLALSVPGINLMVDGALRQGTLEIMLEPSFTAAAVPEPATWALWLGGLAALGGIARRRSTAA
ncbi:MAG: PEP-CTERM sorting domain-containing protein [Aquabacterium sp.]|nr:PEP-CTERM sorting domain-containing protein [Aquabacterium sp.]